MAAQSPLNYEKKTPGKRRLSEGQRIAIEFAAWIVGMLLAALLLSMLHTARG